MGVLADSGGFGHLGYRTESDRLTPLEERFSVEEQPWAFVLPALDAPRGVPGIKAMDCAVCHRAYYEEWQQTTHAHALADMQFQAELAKPDSPKWVCLNCHIPNQDQRQYIVKGLHDNDVMRPVVEVNPGFDRSFQQEAISCATCHVRVDEQGQSVIIGALGTGLAPHPVKQDREALRGICFRCHDPQGEPITANLHCWFNTREELVSNSGMQGVDCVDCHMPETKGSLMQGMPERTRHQHHWVGGGIPKTMEGFEHLAQRGYRTGLEVETHYKGSYGLSVVLSNTAGHYLPTGDPERYIEVIARYYRGDELVSMSAERVGQIWEWNPARKLSDNRLQGDERRELNFEYGDPERLVDDSQPMPERIELTIAHTRLSLENMEHMKKAKVDTFLVPGLDLKMPDMEKHYPRFRILHKRSWILDSDGELLSEERLEFPELNLLSARLNRSGGSP